MSALSKIRENVGLVIVLIAVSLAAFILTDFFTGSSRGMRAGDDVVGEVAGKEVSYREISRRMELYGRNRQDESIEDLYELRQQVWNEVIQEEINNREWQSLGLGVSEQEESMLYFGPIVHPYVYQYPLFRDSLGQFSPEVVRIRFQQADQINENDPSIDDFSRNFKLDMKSLKKAIKNNRMAFKWEQMIRGAMLVSDNEVRKLHEAQQKTVNLTYVSVPYATVTDEQAQPTETDFQDFYNEIKERYKRTQDQINLKYIYFPLKPSREDSMLAKENLARMLPDFKASDNAFDFALTNSDVRGQDTSLKSVTGLPASLQGVTNTDSVIGPVLGEDGFKLYRIVKAAEDSSYVVNARQILVRIGGATAQDTADARSTANQIRNEVRANPASFAQVAAEKSQDFATQQKGGMLGWLDPRGFGDDFSSRVGNAPVGQFVVAQSPQGFHVVEILDRTNKTYSYAEVTGGVIVSTATSDSVYKRASQYAGGVLAGNDMDETLKDFPEAQANVSGAITGDVYKLPGLQGGREVVTWGFGAEEGSISQDILESDNALVIARVESKGGEGYASLDQVRAEITPEVIKRVKARAIKAKLTGGGDLNAISSSYGAGATTGAAPNVSFANSFVPSLGNEPKVVGRAFGLAQGAVSEPIEGVNGVYVIKVDAINEGPALEDAFLDLQRQQIVGTKGNAAINASAYGMRENANIKDLRYKFKF